MSYDSALSRRAVLASAAGLAVALATPVTASAAGFGYTDDGTHYVVETGAGLLTSAQAASDRTLRIGITTAKAGGRPQITVNDSWTSTLPAAATEPSTRTLTVGSYRGNNHTYQYVIPVGRLRAGANTLRIDAASGSAGGGGYLSPSYGFDAIDLL